MNQNAAGAENTSVANVANSENGGKNTASKSGRRYSITHDDVLTLRSVTRKSVNTFTSEDLVKAQKWAAKYFADIGVKSPFFRAWFGEWRAHQTGTKVKVADIPAYIGTNEERKKQRGIVRNSDTNWDIRISRDGGSNTISHSGEGRLSEYGLSGIKALVENATLLNTEVHEHHRNNATNDLIAFDHKLYALGKDSAGTISLYRITVEEIYHDRTNPNDMRFHNLKHIEKVAAVGWRTAGDNLHGVSTNDRTATDYSVADL